MQGRAPLVVMVVVMAGMAGALELLQPSPLRMRHQRLQRLELDAADQPAVGGQTNQPS